MEEREELKNEEPIDDGKIHFPVFGVILISAIILIMAVLIVLIFVFRNR